MIAIDLSKQHALNADPRAIQQITFTGNLGGNTTFFNLLNNKRNCFELSTRNFSRRKFW